VKAREDDRDLQQAVSAPRVVPAREAEPWHAAAGNVAVQAAIRSSDLPASAGAPLDRLLARAPTRRLDRQEVEEEEEEPGAVAAPEGEAAAAPATEAPAAAALDEEELPE